VPWGPPWLIAQPAASAPATRPATTRRSSDHPSARVDEPNYNFGVMYAGPDISHTFRFRNVGSSPLHIEYVWASCGCVVPGDYARTVAPGATWELPVTLKTAGYESGPQHRQILVAVRDGQKGRVAFSITGELRQRLGFEPYRLVQMGRLLNHAVATKTLTITNQTDQPIRLARARASAAFLRAELQETEPGRRWRLNVTTVPPLPNGPLNAKILLDTDVPEEPTIEIPASIFVPSRVNVNPTVVRVPSPVTRGWRQSIVVRNEDQTPVHVTGISASSAAVRTELRELQKGRLWQAWAEISQGTVVPPEGFRVTITTDDREFPELTVMIQAYAPATRPASGPASAPASPVGRVPS